MFYYCFLKSPLFAYNELPVATLVRSGKMSKGSSRVNEEEGSTERKRRLDEKIILNINRKSFKPILKQKKD